MALAVREVDDGGVLRVSMSLLRAEACAGLGKSNPR
jgi:hypothetical protein